VELRTYVVLAASLNSAVLHGSRDHRDQLCDEMRADMGHAARAILIRLPAYFYHLTRGNRVKMIERNVTKYELYSLLIDTPLYC